jgi:hypothetical protein
VVKATTVRFSDEIYARLDQASARTGMPVNSIVIAACLEWMQRHTPQPEIPTELLVHHAGRPRWSTIRRAMTQAVGGRRGASAMYPFERFTAKAQSLLTAAQAEAQKAGHHYIGTEHLLQASFADPTSHSALILASLGLSESLVRSTIEKVLHSKTGPRNPTIVPTSRVKKVIEIAFDLCSSAGDASVTTGHVLLALATEGEGIAAHILKDLGATPKAISAAMQALAEPE